MLSIRFSRFGKRKTPHYRIIVLDNKKDPWGDFIENLGHYNPRTKELEIKADKIKEWIAKGAQPSNSVHNILVSQGVIDAKKKRVSRISKKRKARLEEKKKEEAKTEAPKSEDKPTEEVKPEETKTEEKPAEVKKPEEAKTEDKKTEEKKPEEAKTEEKPAEVKKEDK